ncbi:MAG: response regulator [Eubacteriales bacterium]
MISLMIVDDEQLILRGIRSILKRENHGYILVGEAENGEQAIELAKQLGPEVIITDICMPGMDGLAMIQEIKKFLPNTKFIVLSGYGEFAYAQEAVRLEVSDYLLKPINSKGLYEVLDKISKAQLQEGNKKNLEKNMRIHQWLGRYLLHNEEVALQNLQELLGIKEHFMFEILTIEEKNLLDRQSSRVQEWVENFIVKENYGFAINSKNSMILLLYEKQDFTVNHTNQIILERIKEIFDCDAYIDMALTRDVITQLAAMYDQANTSLTMRFYEVENKQVRIWDGNNLCDLSIEMIQEDYMKELLSGLELGQKESFMESIKRFIQQSEKVHVNPHDLTRYLHGIVRICIVQLQTKGYFQAVNQEILDEHIDCINFCKNKNDFLQNAEYIFDEILELANNNNSSTGSRTIVEVKKYILSNYNKDIGLNEVAEIVYLNPKYLSELFKKETGQTFIAYLTVIRMENAKKLLQKLDYKIYEVAENVGYQNPKTFVKVFKKYTGVTPLEFRNSK